MIPARLIASNPYSNLALQVVLTQRTCKLKVLNTEIFNLAERVMEYLKKQRPIVK